MAVGRASAWELTHEPRYKRSAYIPAAVKSALIKCLPLLSRVRGQILMIFTSLKVKMSNLVMRLNVIRSPEGLCR